MKKFKQIMTDYDGPIIVGMAIIVVFLLMIFLPRAESADITYPGNRGSTKLLKDVGDGIHAPARFIGGEAIIEAAAVLSDSAVAVDTYYVLVDLSDTTNYPHENTTGIDLSQSTIVARQTGDAYAFLLGIVNFVDGSGVTVKTVHRIQVPSTVNTVNNTINYPFGGVDLEVSGTTVVGLISPDIAIAAVTLLTDLASPAGTVNAEVGDLLLFVDEVSGTSTLDWTALVFYGSH